MTAVLFLLPTESATCLIGKKSVLTSSNVLCSIQWTLITNRDNHAVTGTSAAAMRFVGSWLNQLAAVRSFPIQTQFLFGNDVTLSPDSEISQALLHGAAVAASFLSKFRTMLFNRHFQRRGVFFFDPYYEEEGTPEFDAEYYAKGIRFIYDQPKCANRAVSLERINRLSHGYYELGEFSCREALLMFRTSGECEWNVNGWGL